MPFYSWLLETHSSLLSLASMAVSRAWRHTPVTLGLGRLRQAGGLCVFKADLNYAVSGISFLKQASGMRGGRGGRLFIEILPHV